MEQNNKPSLSQFATLAEYRDAVIAFDAANPKRRADDQIGAMVPLEWESPSQFGSPELQAIILANLAAPAVDAAELDKLKALAEAATPGPWEWGGTECHTQAEALAICEANLAATAQPGTHFCEVYLADGRRTALVGNGPTGIQNAEFIAAANPAAILRIAALVAQQAARIEQQQIDENNLQFAFDQLKINLAQQAARIAELEQAARDADAKAEQQQGRMKALADENERLAIWVATQEGK